MNVGRPRRSVVGRGVAAWGGICASALVAASPAPSPDEAPARGLIVKLRFAPQSTTLPESLRLNRVLAAAGVAPQRLRPVGRAAQYLDFDRLLGPTEAEQMAERLRGHAEVEWVVANTREHRLQAAAPPDDSLYPGQWWLRGIGGSNANVIGDRLRGVPGFASAWATTTGAGTAAAVVAVLDTGITAHPDLAGNVLPGYDFVSLVEYANDGNGRDADPSDPGDWVSQADKTAYPNLFGSCPVADSIWHGTIIAGIVAATTNNGVGVAAPHWAGRVLPVRVAGKCGAEVADIIDGMRWAAGLAVAGAPPNPNPARIVNISFGGSAACNAAYQDTIDELTAHGVVVVAAAGNAHAAITRPANCAGVIGVAALNRDGFKASYSNFGAGLSIATIGGDASDGSWTSLLGDGGLLTVDNAGLREPGAPVYSAVSGTSFAAPIVSATISLMLSVNPQLSVAQIIAGIGASARPHVVSTRIAACSALNPGRCICSTKTCGAGILDAEQALRYAQSTEGYQAPLSPLVDLDSAAEVVSATALGADRPADLQAVTNGSAAGAGGATGIGWLLALGAAVLWLRRAARR